MSYIDIYPLNFQSRFYSIAFQSCVQTITHKPFIQRLILLRVSLVSIPVGVYHTSDWGQVVHIHCETSPRILKHLLEETGWHWYEWLGLGLHRPRNRCMMLVSASWISTRSCAWSTSGQVVNTSHEHMTCGERCFSPTVVCKLWCATVQPGRVYPRGCSNRNIMLLTCFNEWRMNGFGWVPLIFHHPFECSDLVMRCLRIYVWMHWPTESWWWYGLVNFWACSGFLQLQGWKSSALFLDLRSQPKIYPYICGWGQHEVGQMPLGQMF